MAPFGTIEADHFERLAIEVENRGGRRSVEPPARLTRIDDHRVTAHAHFLLVRAAVQNDRVRGEGTLLHIANVMDHEDAHVSELDTVWRFVELESHSFRGL